MKNLLTIAFVCVLIAGGYYFKQVTSESMALKNFQIELADLASDLRADEKNKDSIKKKVFALASKFHFEAVKKSLKISSTSTEKKNTMQNFASKLAKITNNENVIELQVKSKMVPGDIRLHTVRVAKLINIKTEQKINPQLQKLLKE